MPSHGLPQRRQLPPSLELEQVLELQPQVMQGIKQRRSELKKCKHLCICCPSYRWKEKEAWNVIVEKVADINATHSGPDRGILVLAFVLGRPSTSVRRMSVLILRQCVSNCVLCVVCFILEFIQIL